MEPSEQQVTVEASKSEENADITATNQMAVPVDETNMSSNYANYCRVTGTPEELLIDFGINKQTSSENIETINISQRIISNYYTAKRLAFALLVAVERHEQAFGVLELDISKRLIEQTKTDSEANIESTESPGTAAK